MYYFKVLRHIVSYRVYNKRQCTGRLGPIKLPQNSLRLKFRVKYVFFIHLCVQVSTTVCLIIFHHASSTRVANAIHRLLKLAIGTKINNTSNIKLQPWQIRVLFSHKIANNEDIWQHRLSAPGHIRYVIRVHRKLY